METTDAFTGLRCTDCEALFDVGEAPGRCPDCGGILDPEYDYDSLDVTRETFSGDGPGLWRYESLMPFPASVAVTLDEGNTPLVEAPALADELGVGQVFIKDEGRNPTGTFKDRGQAMAVTAAAQHGAETVALATAGNAGQAASAYAAKADIDSEAFVPTRASFVNKAMINVHGGEMTVVEGRIGDAGAAYDDAIADHEEWHSVKTFVTPYRHEGKKTMLYETVEQLDWEVPDHVVYPTGGGVGARRDAQGCDRTAGAGAHRRAAGDVGRTVGRVCTHRAGVRIWGNGTRAVGPAGHHLWWHRDSGPRREPADSRRTRRIGRRRGRNTGHRDSRSRTHRRAERRYRDGRHLFCGHLGSTEARERGHVR